MDPSKTQTPLYEDPHTHIQTPQPTHPPSYSSPHSTPISVSTDTQVPYSPAAFDPSASAYDNGHDAPLPVRTASQYAPELAPERLPRSNSHGSSRYLHAVPLHNLSRLPAPVDCPLCNRRDATKCTTEIGNFTHLWAVLTCTFCCLGCIPYLIPSLKDVKHSCSSCGELLAVWHRSGGGTDVLAHAMK
ncbi:LITAF-like zinc ribbon domain-containing protein [Morchella snyderi]|nr:LITAF-like zinc ribbon domain-containing protein [Morchella snyderi]